MIPNYLLFDLNLQDLPARATQVTRGRLSTMTGKFGDGSRRRCGGEIVESDTIIDLAKGGGKGRS